MAPPGNGIFVVRGEMSILMTAFRRGARWNSNSNDDEQDSLMKLFFDLKTKLTETEDLREIDPSVFLSPFLEIIRSEDTTGPITSLALSALNKFLAYGLIDPTHSKLAATVDSIADAVTHARFVGTDQASDGVVLMKIIQVLRTLMLSPEGNVLTNESVCEIMLSCFRICFEPRLNELLRRTAEHALKDMVLLLFMRLPQFAEELQQFNIKKIKMHSSALEQNTKKRKSIPAKLEKPVIPKINTIQSSPQPEELLSPNPNQLKAPPLATTPATPGCNIVDMQGRISQTPQGIHESNSGESQQLIEEEIVEETSEETDTTEGVIETIEAELESPEDDLTNKEDEGEYINSMGVRFTPQTESTINLLLPYGLPCVRELFRFLISLCNPMDKQNSDTMVHMGLSMLTVALEVGADSIGNYDSLLVLVKDELCRNLFSLLNTERLTIFAANIQVCFLLFESLRSNLKFQLEYYLTKISEIIVSENIRILYETRELALDNLLQLWRIPGFAAELYINYDCDLYCTNLFEDLTKLLSKNTLSAIHGQNILSLDTLLTVVDSIEKNCSKTKSGHPVNYTRHSRNSSTVENIVLDQNRTTSESEFSGLENISNYLNSNRKEKQNKNLEAPVLSHEQVMALKDKKKLLTQGTELFNTRPDKGILFLQESGVLNPVLDPVEVAHFLRENPGLDKKMIGEYISKKKNVEIKILETFVNSFDFTNLRVDEALRLYLETFRLPGEAPLIFLVLEHFSEHWHKCNNEPFVNTDAAFRLAYAIIMLNMDQHNHNAKRLNIPMTAADFQKNLRGLNGNADFDQEMLVNVFNAIKDDEIIMPAEQTGLVRENYLWKVLLRRGVCKDGVFHHIFGSGYDKELFQIIWGPILAALSYVFDKRSDASPMFLKSLSGFTKSAAISSHLNLHEDFDALVLTLCKFTTLLNVQEDVNDITVSANFGLNTKAQLAMKTVFGLVHDHGDCMRESWKSILDVIMQLFRLKLLPKSLMEVEDFCEPNGKAVLIHEKPQLAKTDAGLFSSLYSYLSSDSQRQPSSEEQEMIKRSKRCIKECQIDQIISESKFLQFESLQELVKCILVLIKAPDGHKSIGIPYAEDTVVFLFEILIKIIIQNRDRILPLWTNCRNQIYLLLMGGASCGYEYLLIRSAVGILKLAIYLMRNEELCPVVLQSLNMLLMLKPNVIHRISKQISTGMYELLKTSAQNIHTEVDWKIIFTILECVGAGAIPPEYDEHTSPNSGAKSEGAVSSEEDSGIPDRGYISDSELIKSHTATPLISPSGDSWILVNKDSENSSLKSNSIVSLEFECKLLEHSPFALVKSWDCLAFIVRNVAHITPYNFESCVKCIRIFVEATLNGGKKNRKKNSLKKNGIKKRGDKKRNGESSESDSEELPDRYETIAIQVLDLMHTLHTRTAQIFRWWAEEGGAIPQCSALWEQGWCPILQGIARLVSDQRRQVRTCAVTCLQRALLVHDLQTLSGPEWSSCFKQVLFPLLTELLQESDSHHDPNLIEESRMRTATIMSKVFLHHLTPLISLASFNELWIEILDYLEKFIRIGPDMLYEAVLESLKNMLLVMHSVRVFHNSDGLTHSDLWDITWTRVGVFLPQLKEELFKNEPNETNSINSGPHMGQQRELNSPTAVSPPMNFVKNTILPSPSSENFDIPKSSVILQPPVHIENATGSPLLNNPAPIPIYLPQQFNSQQFNQPPQQQPPQQQPPQQQQPPPPMQFVPPTPIVSDSADDFYRQNALNYMNSSPMHTTYIPSSTMTQEITRPEIPLSFNSSPIIESVNIIEMPDILQEDEEEQVIIKPTDEDINPPIPISHLTSGNAYPSLNRVPTNIAQSFAPVYVQPQNQALSGNIYNDYVNNPYNLTLQQDDGVVSNTQEDEIEKCENSSPHKLAANPNIFQSSNYFGSDTTGSEALFGGS